MKNTRLTDVLKNLDLLIAAAALFVLVAITFMGVIFRYVIGKPFVWQEEVQLWCFLWIVFFGAGAAFRHGGHVAIEILVDMFPKKIIRAVEVFGLVLSVGILGYLGLQGCRLVEQYLQTGRTTSILSIPFPVVYLAVPVGCVLMIANHVIAMIRQWRSGAEEEEAAQWE